MVCLSVQCPFYTNQSGIWGKKHILACIYTHIKYNHPHTFRDKCTCDDTCKVCTSLYLLTVTLQRLRSDIFIALRWIFSRLVPFILLTKPRYKFLSRKANKHLLELSGTVFFCQDEIILLYSRQVQLDFKSKYQIIPLTQVFAV